MTKLTVKKVERAHAPGRYADGQNLYLEISKAGVKSWTFRYARGGKERWMGLGPVHTIDLSEARERARRARQQLLDGIDPLDAKEAERQAEAVRHAKRTTFEQAVEGYFADNADKWKNKKHRAQFTSTLRTFAYPIFQNLPIDAIDTSLVLRVLRQEISDKDGNNLGPFWKCRTETASRVLQRIAKVLGWATVNKLRNGDNPAMYRGHISEVLHLNRKVTHHCALPYDELPAFMARLRERQGTAARALEFTVLTAARTSAVTGARWSEIDFDEALWTVPATRVGTKIKGEHSRRVSLSPQAIALLKAVPREDGNDYVFVGPTKGRGLSNMALRSVVKRMRLDVTVHGFRSTFKDWVSDRTNYPNHVSEAALWHVVADKVEAAYRRTDLLEKRKRLMRDWANYCYSPASSPTEVTLLRAG